MTREEAITEISDIRSRYNCFDTNEEPKYRALSIAIEAVREHKTGTFIKLTRTDGIDVLVNPKKIAYITPWQVPRGGLCALGFDGSDDNYIVVKESLSEIQRMVNDE